MRMAIALSGVLLVSACMVEDMETAPVSGDAAPDASAPSLLPEHRPLQPVRCLTG